MVAVRPDSQRIVITGIGLTAPNGNSLPEFRRNLLAGRSGVVPYETRYFGTTLAGVCNFDELSYQRKKDVRRGTRAGSIGIFCSHEAIRDSGLDWDHVDKSAVGIYVGVTEHGNVETENEIYLIKQYGYDTQFWSHHHNPRTVANNPAGEISLNLKITGPHYCLGAACAAGNAGIIQAPKCSGWKSATWPYAAECRRAFIPSEFLPVFTARERWPGTRTRPRRRGRLTPTETGSWWPRVAVCSFSNG